MPVDMEAVRRCLNEIVDPCSANAGCATGLVDMGLVRALTVGAGRIEVLLRLTEPGCAMAMWFLAEARARLLRLPGVEVVEVRLDPEPGWREADLSPAARAVLHRRRGANFKGPSP